jgi:hypothetical protein
MLIMTGLILLILGIVVWLYGNRMWLLGAGAGALLGVGLLGLFPSLTTGWLGFFIVVGLAILFGVLGFFGKAFASIIAMVIGFIAGGAVMMNFLEIFSVSSSLWIWILALIGGVIGAALFARFMDWGLIIFASLLGSMLIVHGAIPALLPSLAPSMAGTIGTLIILVLTGLGIFYHSRRRR